MLERFWITVLNIVIGRYFPPAAQPKSELSGKERPGLDDEHVGTLFTESVYGRGEPEGEIL
jgi:hypothetical protein